MSAYEHILLVYSLQLLQQISDRAFIFVLKFRVPGVSCIVTWSLAISTDWVSEYNLHNPIIPLTQYLRPNQPQFGQSGEIYLIWLESVIENGREFHTHIESNLTALFMLLFVGFFYFMLIHRSELNHLDLCNTYDDVIKWKHFPRNWPFVRGIHRSRWILHTKASYAELWYFLWSASK